jgi:hypothetical protein
MPDIAEFVRDGSREGKREGNYILLQLIAAQVVARAAYEGKQFRTIEEIGEAVNEIAGYPIRNKISGPPTRPDSDVLTKASYPVAWLVGLRVE